MPFRTRTARKSDELLAAQRVGDEPDRLGKVVGDEVGTVPAWVNMRSVLQVQRTQQLIDLAQALVEAVVVLVAAVEVDLQIAQPRRVLACQGERRVLLPEGLVKR